MVHLWSRKGDFWFNIETGEKVHKSVFWWLDA